MIAAPTIAGLAARGARVLGGAGFTEDGVLVAAQAILAGRALFAAARQAIFAPAFWTQCAGRRADGAGGAICARHAGVIAAGAELASGALYAAALAVAAPSLRAQQARRRAVGAVSASSAGLAGSDAVADAVSAGQTLYAGDAVVG